MAAEAKIDEEEAGLMLAAGAAVRDVAHRYGVSTQAVYLAIQQGRLPRQRQRQDIDENAKRNGADCAGSSLNPSG